MEKDQIPQGFQPFTWGLAIFCLPILLWPLALLISPNLSKNPLLSDGQINGMSVFLWSYPFILAILARLLFKLRQHRPQLAKRLLILLGLLFYLVVVYIAVVGFTINS
ncbi:DUF5389 family protein [Volucribacter amazonae]|uniref:DUF5389 domain-containing protein n=1 Tax=Volucribacter amazonae TaxID=256731 RepID=A0A9X4PPP6_9PAST|nr:DUF5389 family protein [Volucribacter amazonae]MDG6895313.1 hypothetical protein [Volucribacter amazonae]